MFASVIHLFEAQSGKALGDGKPIVHKVSHAQVTMTGALSRLMVDDRAPCQLDASEAKVY